MAVPVFHDRNCAAHFILLPVNVLDPESEDLIMTIVKKSLLFAAFLMLSAGTATAAQPVTWDEGTTTRIGNVELKDGNVGANGVRAKNVSGSTVSGNYIYAHGGMVGDVKFGTDGTVTGIPDAGDLATADPTAAVNVKTLKEEIEKLQKEIEALKAENEELKAKSAQ